MVTGENTDRRAYSTDKMDRGTGNLKAHSKGRMDRLMSRYTSGRWEVGNESSSRVVVVKNPISKTANTTNIDSEIYSTL